MTESLNLMKARTGREKQVYKGNIRGWENDESKQEAAIRETYEEVTSLIGVWDHNVVNKKTGLPKSTFSFFEMEVERLEERWPEMDERDRQWVCFAYDDALKVLIKPFMREVVEQCSLAPSNKKSKKSEWSGDHGAYTFRDMTDLYNTIKVRKQINLIDL
ncbi:4975_t:CDS:2 [Racocetra fulgida]|uniref:4975_t:CDS:1 n=1 Tax=Racocetra fulgida TaxID=60492 RepID=A0A9N8W801_9GLOM|nr:4975_t:CDS:2 [Racocetra fulgida]